MNYSILETAIVDEVRAHLQVDHRDQVVAGDVDRLVKQFIEGGKNYGVLLEFGGGVRRGRSEEEPFKQRIWQWSIIAVYMLRYTGDTEEIEANLRESIDRLSSLFSTDHTLGGLTPWVRLERIDQAEIVRMNDIPLYWIPFEIMVFEKT